MWVPSSSCCCCCCCCWPFFSPTHSRDQINVAFNFFQSENSSKSSFLSWSSLWCVMLKRKERKKKKIKKNTRIDKCCRRRLHRKLRYSVPQIIRPTGQFNDVDRERKTSQVWKTLLQRGGWGWKLFAFNRLWGERWSAERRVGASFAKSLKLTRDSATRQQTAAAAAAE